MHLNGLKATKSHGSQWSAPVKIRFDHTVNTDMQTMRTTRVKRDALHYMLHVAFIEIRSANSLNAAKKFAYVFHNLPMGLLRCSTSEDYDAEFAKLMARAKRQGLDGYLQNLLASATKAVAEETINTFADSVTSANPLS